MCPDARPSVSSDSVPRNELAHNAGEESCGRGQQKHSAEEASGILQQDSLMVGARRALRAPPTRRSR
jgi:hypothetical protein